jgi:hypothetical protein
MEPVPTLGLLAALAALGDLAVNRVLVRILDAEHAVLVSIDRFGEVLQNLAAVAALVALAIGLSRFLVDARYVRIRRRLGLAAFSGVFVPTALLSTFLPAKYITRDIVTIGGGAAHVLVIMLALTAARYRASWGVRVAVLALGLSSFGAFNSLVLRVIPPIAVTRPGLLAAGTLHATGEAAYLLVAFAAVVALWPRVPDSRSRVAIAAALVAGLGVGALIVWGDAALGPTFPIVFAGATDLELLVEPAIAVYAVCLGVAIAAGVLGLLHRSAAERQVGVALLLLVAAGYAPRTPSRMLMMVLGAVLLARATIALGERLSAAAEAAPREPPPGPPEVAQTGAPPRQEAPEPTPGGTTESEDPESEDPASEDPEVIVVAPGRTRTR